MLPKKTKKYSFNYCSCCQRQKQLRLKISTSTYLLRASSAALSFGLKNKTELKNVTDRLNRWCASGPGLDIIQLLLLKHLHDYTFLGPKILKIKPKKPNISNSNSRIFFFFEQTLMLRNKIEMIFWHPFWSKDRWRFIIFKIFWHPPLSSKLKRERKNLTEKKTLAVSGLKDDFLKALQDTNSCTTTHF